VLMEWGAVWRFLCTQRPGTPEVAQALSFFDTDKALATLSCLRQATFRHV
jgi:hypothetical protein